MCQVSNGQKDCHKEIRKIGETCQERIRKQRRGIISIRRAEMYMTDTIDITLGIAKECCETLKLNGVKNVGKIIFEPVDPDETPRDWIGGMIFECMSKLHRMKFGLFTTETISKMKNYVMDDLMINITDSEPYKVSNTHSITDNVVGLLNTIVRLLITYDTRYYLI